MASTLRSRPTRPTCTTPAGSTSGNVIVRDLTTGTNELASIGTDGLAGAGATFPNLSRSGRYVAFSGSASTLVPGDTTNQYDVFVRDLVNDVTRRVSVSTSGVAGNGPSGLRSVPSISSNGAHVAFDSRATNLVPLDKNGVLDVFARLNWAS